MKTVSPAFVNELIDFAPTEETREMGFADAQRDGTVALFNMLQRNKVAYLADEVGRWCAETSVRRGPGHRDGRRGMIST